MLGNLAFRAFIALISVAGWCGFQVIRFMDWLRER